MNILVLGSNSFLANEFIKYYIKNKDDIYAISRKKNKHINDQNYINYYDIENQIYKIQNIHFDLVLNFISQKFIKKILLNNNLSALFILIPYLKKIKINKIIFFSSISVYENLKIENINTESITKPQSIYANNKLFEENLIINLQNDMVYNILRIPMVIGDNMKTKIFSYLNFFLKYKLFLIIHNPYCVINYISIDKLIFYINNDLMKIKENKIINLSHNITFNEIYKLKNIKIKKRFFNTLFKNFIRIFVFINFFNESYKFLYNKKIISSNKIFKNNDNKNEFTSFLG